MRQPRFVVACFLPLSCDGLSSSSSSGAVSSSSSSKTAPTVSSLSSSATAPTSFRPPPDHSSSPSSSRSQHDSPDVSFLARESEDETGAAAPDPPPDPVRQMRGSDVVSEPKSTSSRGVPLPAWTSSRQQSILKTLDEAVEALTRQVYLENASAPVEKDDGLDPKPMGSAAKKKVSGEVSSSVGASGEVSSSMGVGASGELYISDAEEDLLEDIAVQEQAVQEQAQALGGAPSSMQEQRDAMFVGEKTCFLHPDSTMWNLEATMCGNFSWSLDATMCGNFSWSLDATMLGGG